MPTGRPGRTLVALRFVGRRGGRGAARPVPSRALNICLSETPTALAEWRHLLTTTDTATSGEFQEKERGEAHSPGDAGRDPPLRAPPPNRLVEPWCARGGVLGVVPSRTGTTRVDGAAPERSRPSARHQPQPVPPCVCNPAELRTGVLKARKMIVELDKVVNQLEAKRGQHADVDSAELARRRETLSRHEASVVAIEKALESRQARDKRAKDKDTAERNRRKKEREAEAAAETAAARAHGDFLGQHQSMQQLERERQDEQIDRIDGILETTHQRAILIGQELKHQHTALEDMHGEMTEARTGIEGATARIQALLKTKDNRMICLIIVLIVILVVLGVVALS
ncbi:unnamed protein product [Symbiodinium sp. KB8]|nr:unnamed protein product [Symbiodinium sp. KB8]